MKVLFAILLILALVDFITASTCQPDKTTHVAIITGCNKKGKGVVCGKSAYGCTCRCA